MQPAGAGTPGTELAAATRTPWELFWQRFRSDRVALVGLTSIAFEVVIAIAAPLIVKAVAHAPNAQFPNTLDQRFGTPTGRSWSFLFGVRPRALLNEALLVPRIVRPADAASNTRR